tara:strand:- start:181 stop:1221 length:1041 start_codon:yes stop_codon:yes gene_type:complete
MIEKEVNYFKILLRLIISGIGLGVIVGTILKTINIKTLFSLSSYSVLLNKNSKKEISYKREVIPERLTNKDEIELLSLKWKQLASKHDDLIASGFMFSLDDKKYAQLLPNKKLSAASSIKIAILLATFKMMDTGSLEWDEDLYLTNDVIGGGSGWIQYQPLGKKFAVHEVATEMIRISDNTATNLLIKRLGGKDILNEYFKGIGLQSTQINNLLPDLKGTNITSTKDLVRVLAMTDVGNLISLRSRDLFREIMSTSNSNRLIPGGVLKGLGEENKNHDYNLMIKGYKVYNKTGDIGIAYADAALIQLPNNKRVIASFIVQGPFNDPRSSQLIRDMSSEMVDFFRVN